MSKFIKNIIYMYTIMHIKGKNDYSCRKKCNSCRLFHRRGLIMYYKHSIRELLSKDKYKGEIYFYSFIVIFIDDG